MTLTTKDNLTDLASTLPTIELKPTPEAPVSPSSSSNPTPLDLADNQVVGINGEVIDLGLNQSRSGFIITRIRLN
jgi:hypothetical protein